jgi:DNA phosphorothioation-dependent restriction protein DptG
LLDKRSPTAWVCESRHYGLFSLNGYRFALTDEIEQLAAEDFETIRNTAPPTEFIELWRRDIEKWFESLPEPNEAETKQFVDAMRLFTPVERKVPCP